jgi:hypothetical protein
MRSASGPTIRHRSGSCPGVGGFLMSRILKRVREKMLDVGLPSILDQLDAAS